jgi:hypothetical protein
VTAKRHARGDWRPFFENWPDGPDFQLLSPPARLVLYTLKLKLGAAGLRAIAGREAALVEWTGYPIDVVTAAEEELGRTGWVQFDGPLAWLVRGLEFEPTMSPNDPKHRTWLCGYLLTMPSRPILGRFRDHYAKWFPDNAEEGPSKGLRRGSEGASRTLRSTSPSPSPSPSPKEQSGGGARARVGRPTDGEQLVRRLTDSAEIRAVVEAAGPKGGSAIEGYLRASQDPPRLWLELQSYLEGHGAPGGRPVTPAQLGAALHAMAMAEPPAKMGQKTLAAFVRRELEEPAPPRNGARTSHAESFEEDLVAAGRRLDEQAAAKRRAAHA